MTARVVGVLQARLSSSRLPGKALKPILGAPMLGCQLERLGRAAAIDRLVVATSDDPADGAIAALCADRGIACFRGSLDDVLDRCFRAVAPYDPSHVVRLTGDCPLADWTVINRAVAFCLDGDYDYASNTVRPTWPDGLDVEVMRFAALAEAEREAVLPSEREHVTPFIHRHPARYRLGSLEQGRDLSALRWTVDEPADFAFVSAVYAALYPGNAAFTTDDVLALLDARPELAAINAGFERNAGMKTSLAADAVHRAASGTISDNDAAGRAAGTGDS